MTPYKTGAPVYQAAGWTGIIPLPPGKKDPPPSSYTGWQGRDPSRKMIDTWMAETVGDYQGASNIAIRMPDDVIGIDVDHYDGKTGGDTLAKLEAELGPLPPTYISTSRDDGVSGIRWYRVEPGLRWPTGPGKDIEFVHSGHRYALVWPSIHPEGGQYIWVDHTGLSSEPPEPDNLAELPWEWVARFTGGEKRVEQDIPTRNATEDELATCLTDGPICYAATKALNKFEDRLTVQARHDSALRTVMALCRLGEQGHKGVNAAIAELRNRFINLVTKDRADGSEGPEYQRMVDGGVVKVLADPTPEQNKGCCGSADYQEISAQELYALAGVPMPGAPESSDETVTFDSLVAKEVVKIRVREAARELVDAHKRPPAEPFDAGTLGEMLARPRPPQGRVDGLIPWEASTLIPAQRKTGKTTLLLNLSRSLLTGEPFLGTFDVQPVDGLITLLNYEVSGDTIAQWANQSGLDPDRFFIVNLRGRRNPLADPEDRGRFAELLRNRGTESLLTDPFGRAYTGQSQNDPGEVGGWLADLDRFTRGDVGARDLILTTHAGWNQERTRGSSALEDWADSIITMTRDDSEDGNGERYLRAIGRDVDLEEDQLIYDPNTRTLTLAGSGSRKAAKDTRRNDKLDRAVLAVVTAEPGLNTTQIGDKVHAAGVGFQRGDIGHAATRLTEAKHLRMEPGPKNAKNYYPTENLFDDQEATK